MAKKSGQPESKNVGTIWFNSTNPERFVVVSANEDLKTVFEQVLSVEDPAGSDEELRQLIQVAVDTKLNVPVIDFKRPIADEMCFGQIKNNVYCHSGHDLPLFITAQIYDCLVQVFSDCNTERTKECQKLYEHFFSEFLARAIHVGKVDTK